MTRRLDYLRRLIGTGLSFTIFGAGGVLMSLLVFPWLLLIRDREQRRRRSQRLISWCFRRFVGMMRAFGILEVELIDGHKLLRPGCVIVANHPSLIDVVLLIAVMDEVDCIVKQSLWRNPAMAAPLRAAGYIGNSEGPELVARCCDRLQRGHRLIIFPEGTRSRPGEPLRFLRGAANIAIQAGADLVPVLIDFSEATLTKGKPWYHIPSSRFRVRIRVADVWPVAPYCEDHAVQAVAARKLTRDLHAFYSARLSLEPGSKPMSPQRPRTRR